MKTAPPPSPILSKDRKSLRDFVDENQKTIAVIGVFYALGIFWTLNPRESEIPYVAYLCFFITVPLFFEVFRHYDPFSSKWQLSVFMNVFAAIGFLTLYNLLTAYPKHAVPALMTVVWVLVSGILLILIEKIGDWMMRDPYEKALELEAAFDRGELLAEKRDKSLSELNHSLNWIYLSARVLQIIAMAGSLLIGSIIFAFASHIVNAWVTSEVLQKPINVEQPKE